MAALDTYFSLSPSHLETRSAEDTEKNVELFASVATAFARNDFPVPGGCKMGKASIICSK